MDVIEPKVDETNKRKAEEGLVVSDGQLKKAKLSNENVIVI